MIRVSLIENNIPTRYSIAKFLELQDDIEVGAIHESATGFLDALILHPPDQPHILLLDIGLPGMSGITAIPLILEKYPTLNIVILTVFEEENLILRAFCAGACSYISKTATLQAIVDAIRIVANGGSYMSPSIAREIVNHLMGGRVSKASILTDRQKEILSGLMDGKTYQEIALDLFISVETVRSHIKKMYKTIHVNNKTEAITKYMKGHIR